LRYIASIFIFLISPLSLVCEVIPPVESLRKAIEFEWLAPEQPFKMGEILHFTVIGRNTASDTAICYALDAAEIHGDSLEPFLVVKPVDKYVSDTLPPGGTATYYYVLVDDSQWLYDPLKSVRSYKDEVGLPCLPPGEYKLKFRRRWDRGDSLDFKMILPESDKKTLLDSLALAFIAFQVGRYEDAIKTAFWLNETAPESPFTARCLILGRGIAWNQYACEEAMALDSLFWESFGGPEIRYRYIGYPGIMRATGGIIQRCAEPERQARYLDRLEKKFPDECMREEIDAVRKTIGLQNKDNK